ncbi:hypothetical protein EDD11_000233, partial [Mortierella claussenii]
MSSRTMTLRNGKAVAKEVAHAVASVDGAMEAMTIAPDEHSHASVTVSSTEMEVDEGDEDESVEEDDPVTIESVREHIRALGVVYKEKNQNKMAYYARLSKGGTEADRARYDAMCLEAEALKKDIDTWKLMVSDHEAAEEVIASMAPPPMDTTSTASPVATPKAEYESEIKLSLEFPRYHRKVEAHLMPKIDSKVSGPVRTNVREFLHEFRKTGVLKYGRKKFGSICYRLLSLANLDEKTADAFVVAHDEDPEGVWDWDRCEQTFVDSALTTLEKAAEVDEFAKAGRERSESYKEFSYRLKRL